MPRHISILLLLTALLAACGAKHPVGTPSTNRPLQASTVSATSGVATTAATALPATSVATTPNTMIQDLVGGHPLQLALAITIPEDAYHQGLPNAIAIDKQGNIYVGDSNFNAQGRIQVFDASGKLLRRWPGGSGSADGQFNYITSLALDDQGNLYATDFENLRVQKFNSSGTFLAKIATEAPVGPVGVAVDRQGNIYVSNHRTHDHYVQKFGSAGHLLLEWGGNGTGDGQFGGVGFNGPDQIALGPHGNIYVTDPLNSRIQKFDPNGTFLAAIGGKGSNPGQFTAGPYGVAVDKQGNIYASDLDGSIQKFDGSGHVLSKWPKTGASRIVVVDGQGNLYIKDNSDGTVKEYRQR